MFENPEPLQSCVASFGSEDLQRKDEALINILVVMQLKATQEMVERHSNKS
jgi:hypothetical protein